MTMIFLQIVLSIFILSFAHATPPVSYTHFMLGTRYTVSAEQPARTLEFDSSELFKIEKYPGCFKRDGGRLD